MGSLAVEDALGVGPDGTNGTYGTYVVVVAGDLLTPSSYILN